MTEPLDLAECRHMAKQAMGIVDARGPRAGGYLLAACDEIERLRAENTVLRAHINPRG